MAEERHSGVPRVPPGSGPAVPRVLRLGPAFLPRSGPNPVPLSYTVHLSLAKPGPCFPEHRSLVICSSLENLRRQQLSPAEQKALGLHGSEPSPARCARREIQLQTEFWNSLRNALRSHLYNAPKHSGSRSAQHHSSAVPRDRTAESQGPVPAALQCPTVSTGRQHRGRGRAPRRDPRSAPRRRKIKCGSARLPAPTPLLWLLTVPCCPSEVTPIQIEKCPFPAFSSLPISAIKMMLFLLAVFFA